MRSLDGEAGGGGMVRTALTLSAASGIPFEMAAIRGARPEPGLRPQHLAAVETVATLCDADVSGAEVGSESLTFRPGDEWETTVDIDIGTAGSLTLLFDAALPLASVADEPLSITATGGTDVTWSPTMAYYRQVKLPLLRQFGLEASVEVERAGFYPTGGGEATLTARPSTLSPLTLERRGDLERVDVYSTASEHLEDAEVADRQADEASAVLSDARLTVAQADVSYVPSASPGSAITVAGTYERSRLGADELGERGRPSEDVGAAAAEQFLDAHDRGAAVDTDMADQAMVYLALAGGTVQIPAVTDHVETNLRVIEAFDYPLSLDERDGRATLHAPPSAER